jgi:hypothetical protein
MDRFASIIACACKAVGAAQHTGLPGPIAAIIWSYLRRVEKRFARLVERAKAGTLPPPRKRKPPPEGADPPKRSPRETPKLRMWGFGWIAKRAQGAVSAGWQLRALLADPAMGEVIGLDPRIPAMLRSLCTALAMTPDQLPPPPPRARRARAEREPKPARPPRKMRAKKVRWKAAKPPGCGLEFSDPSLNLPKRTSWPL